ncbi:glycosyl hydrolase [Bradyrhizobium sp. NP1]|uniref:glycosyl hydrolase n=1 Tax=Bradyrhizobium sp. NP1 TaxID=3049772 RepID=UPI0025A63842|nr:glycosyl hydrolase [Bradyrhizobium sp. NP1]WJR81404.1 glycosyl hydrolase [Bradyrhizobium sp. NP1]
MWQSFVVGPLSRLVRGRRVFLLSILMLNCVVAAATADDRRIEAPASDLRDNRSPWGVATGGEWLSAFPAFNPLLKQAGVGWLRAFYEWQTIEPKHGYWNFVQPDRLVENARANDLRLIGVFAYLANWASADGGTRKFPIKDIQYWRDYVAAMVGRYHSDIKYWEVWNEFNGSFAENGSPEIYAELVREASVAAKKIDPTAKVGMSVANFDVGFLDRAIKAGAANHFDFVCVHPYEKLGQLNDNGEPEFLSMAGTLRQMLVSNGQSADTPLWITEIGEQAPLGPNKPGDERQAVALAKAYLLSIAAGFQRVFWFEARGPAYGNGMDHGLVRADFSPRPAYQALKTMTGLLGSQPAYAGWLDLGGGYGFVFHGAAGDVLAAWSPPNRPATFSFGGDVVVADLAGNRETIAAGRNLALNGTPVLISGLPHDLVQKAELNRGSAFPWSARHVQGRLATVRLQATNLEDGVKQINMSTTKPVGLGDKSWRQTDFSRPDAEGHYVYFAVDPQFLPFGTRDIEITAVVRRITPDKMAGMNLNYESQRGYVDAAYQNIPAGDDWQELTWKLSDANFVGQWGWNFRLNGIASPSDFFVKEVRVRNGR